MDYKLIAPRNEQLSIVEQVLVNRGIKIGDIDHYLNVSEADNLSPILLNNIERAAVMLIKHISKEDNIIKVQIDSDYDGYASASLLLNYIHARFPSAINKFVYSLHNTKTHGIDMDAIPEKTTLVIAPDSSSNEEDKHLQLMNRGIDVLVLDHHHADRESSYACVVNNQLCDYPTKSLCGADIVYKLCQYMDSLFEDDMADRFIDIAGSATIADMMDLRDFETHYLVQQGLKHLRNPFIKGTAAKNEYSLGKTLTPIGVAFYIVPLVNAVTRVGTMEEKILLFESMLEWKAYDMIPSTKRGCKGQQETRLEQSLRMCTNVKNRQTREQDAATEQIEKIIVEKNLLQHKILVVQLDALTFDRGIIGLVANRLMAEYQRPVCLLVKDEHNGKIIWSGSLRACGVEDFRSFCENTGLVEYAQGHPSAAGLSILDENIGSFIKLCDQEFADKDFSPNYKVDFIYSSSTLKPKDILDLESLKPLYGQEISESLIAVEHVTITKDMIHLMSRDKNPTLKIELPNGVTCIKFKSSEEELDSLYSESGCTTINLVGKAEVNKYFNSVTPQIIIQDYEIINRQNFYF